MQTSSFAISIAMPVRLLLFILFFPACLKAQTYTTTRTSSGLIGYDIVLGVLSSPSPTTSSSYGSVTDTAFVTDASHTNFATLTARCFNLLGLGRAGEAWIQPKFPAPLGSGTTAFLRIDLPASSGLSLDVLDLVGDLTNLFNNDLVIVSAYYGATTTDTGTRISSSKVHKALVKDTAGNYYIAVTVDSAFNAARIGLRFNSGFLGVSLGASLSMHVYYGVQYTVADCDGRPEYTDLGTHSGLSVTSLDSVVNNPIQAIDTSLSTSSRLGGSGLLSVGVAFTIAQTFYFKTTYPATDRIRIILSTPGTILDLGLANGIKVAAFRRDTLVSEQSLGSMLSLSLLAGLSAGPGTVYVDPGGDFDKVRITYDHLVGATLIGSGLHIHDIRTVPPSPVLSRDTVTIYPFTTPLITATVTTDNEAWWYNPLDIHFATGTAFPTTDTISTSALYYARASRIFCPQLSDTSKFWIRVIPLSYADPVVGTQGVSYTDTLITLAGPGISGAGFRYTFAPGHALPAGLTLHSNGSITGTPAVTDTLSFTVLLNDTVNSLDAGRHAFNIVIRASLVLPPMSLPAGTAGSPYLSALLPANGGTGNYTYSLSASTPLPPGLSYDSLTHTISGTAAMGTYNILIDVVDDEGRAASQTYLLDIGAPLPIVLVSFEGRQQGREHVLQWQLQEEEMIQQMMLQNSTDGRSWKSIYTDIAKGATNYVYRNKLPYAFSGDMYYRLVLEYNHEPLYSHVVSLKTEEPGQMIAVFPNPAAAGTCVQIASRKPVVAIQVYSAGGKRLSEPEVQNGTCFLPDLPAGMYSLLLYDNEGELQYGKIEIR